MSRAAVAALLTALAVTGCGSPSPDLFEVTRSGRDRNANLRLVVSDGGGVRCNDREEKALDADRLLDARQLARDLETQAALGLELPPAKGSDPTLSYRVRLEDGTIAFSDTSRGRPPSFDRLAAFTKAVAEDVCGVER